MNHGCNFYFCKMNASIVTIGDEILIGQIVDTNSAWIAENLSLAGIEVIEKRAISDRKEDILNVLNFFEGKVELVIITGGLGPTKDDITKPTLANFFGGEMKENKEVLDHIISLFEKRGFVVSELNRLQAVIPDSCTPLKNRQGTAPGMVFEKSGTMYISLPGVPYEMKTIFKEEVIPLLAKRMNGSMIFHRTVMTQGIPESYLAARIQDWEEALPSNIKLAYLPRPGIVRLRLTAIGEKKERLNALIEEEIAKLLKIIPDDVFAFDDIPLEQVIGEILKEKGKTLSTAESCTGGKISSMITSVPGSSSYFAGSVVSYSNKIKEDLLDVDAEIIKSYGAVSKEAVQKMAENVREKFQTDYSISVSGIAGPGGGSEEKPVGTTWICVSSREKTISKMFKFGDHRGRNIQIASYTALNMLRKLILGLSVK